MPPVTGTFVVSSLLLKRPESTGDKGPPAVASGVATIVQCSRRTSTLYTMCIACVKATADAMDACKRRPRRRLIHDAWSIPRCAR
jgi:hypothetical protein